MSAEGPKSPFGVIFLKLIRRCALVAQLDRAFGYEPKGRRFESFRAHHFLTWVSKLWVTDIPQ